MNEDCKCCYLEIIYDYYITHIHSLSLVLTLLIEETKGAEVSVTIECHIVYTLRPKWRRRESLHTSVSKLVIMHRLIIDLMGQAVVIILCPWGRRYQGQACEADASEEERVDVSRPLGKSLMHSKIEKLYVLNVIELIPSVWGYFYITLVS